MEVDHMAYRPRNKSTLAVRDNEPGYGNSLMDLGDWESENPYDPKPKLIFVPATKSDPIHAVRFHDACQVLGVVAIFDVREISPHCFSGDVQFAGMKVDHEGTAASKKLVKEALCSRALPILESLSADLKTHKASMIEEAQRKVLSSPLNAENWIGTLQNYTQKVRVPKPQFNELMTDRTPFEYACTVSVQGGELTTFGSTEQLFSTKANARKSAAREAVLYLRSQGKADIAAPISPCTAAQQKKLIPQAASMNAANGEALPGLFQQPVSGSVSTIASESLPNQIHALVASLGLQQPSFNAQTCPAPPSVGRNENLAGFVNMAARFRDADVQREPRLAGDQGVVKQVYGRKKAKELCCRELLRVLEEIRRGRGG